MGFLKNPTKVEKPNSNKKRLFITLLFVALFVSTIIFFFAKYERNRIYHTISEAPRGINVTYYDGILSRGFSWWTKPEKDIKSLIYLSEKKFDKKDLSLAKNFSGDVKSSHINGIYRALGTEEIVLDPSRRGKLLAVKYLSHSVKVLNLLPAQKYYYAVGYEKNLFYGSFETENDLETTIVNFNDFQTSDYSKLYMGGRTLKAANNAALSNIDFYAFGGDFTSVFFDKNKFYNRYLGWIKSRDSLAKYIGSKPLMMTSGNHDMQDNLFVKNNSVQYDNSSSTGGYYSFNYNNVHFVSLNTNEWDRKQFLWLQKDLESSVENSTWTIIMLHIGPYTTGDHGISMDNDYIKQISGICSKYHVDLVLQAHDHTYSKTLPYLWDSPGFTTDENNSSVINRDLKTISNDGIEYDYNPMGTYYISCGASGHRVGENGAYAQSYGKKSFKNRNLKVATSTITIDSDYADIGDVASTDTGKTMFGILYIKGLFLSYDFYVVDENGNAQLFDRLAISKSVSR
ncbi:MAG: metallophosphoesterase [Clostridia bacterium]|nr:metallophosphoesterase [Clostridia bacterium]